MHLLKINYKKRRKYEKVSTMRRRRNKETRRGEGRMGYKRTREVQYKNKM
jgi:hypothetical protein